VQSYDNFFIYANFFAVVQGFFENDVRCFLDGLFFVFYSTLVLDFALSKTGD